MEVRVDLQTEELSGFPRGSIFSLLCDSKRVVIFIDAEEGTRTREFGQVLSTQ
jgi:hypothetical protein